MCDRLASNHQQQRHTIHLNSISESDKRQIFGFLLANCRLVLRNRAALCDMLCQEWLPKENNHPSNLGIRLQ